MTLSTPLPRGVILSWTDCTSRSKQRSKCQKDQEGFVGEEKGLVRAASKSSKRKIGGGGRIREEKRREGRREQ